MLPTKDPPQNKRPTQIDCQRLEKNIPCKWTGKKIQGTNNYIWQNRLQNKGHKKRHRKTLHNTQGKNQEDINIINSYAPNIGAPKYIREILEDFKKDKNSNTLILGDFKTDCQKWIDLPN